MRKQVPHRADAWKDWKPREMFFIAAPLPNALPNLWQPKAACLTYDDMANYRVRWEHSRHRQLQGLSSVCVRTVESGSSLLQTLQILNETDLSALEHNSTEYIHVVLEALKLAFADREAHYGDPRFVNVPMQELLSPAYAARRSAEIDTGTCLPRSARFGLADRLPLERGCPCQGD